MADPKNHHSANSNIISGWRNLICHPDAPAGGGGPGFFSTCGPVGTGSDEFSSAPHPQSPSGRDLVFSQPTMPHGLSAGFSSNISSSFLLGAIPAFGGSAAGMADSDLIKIAIDLFRNTPVAKTPVGSKTLDALDKMYKAGNIKFEVMEPGLEGVSYPGSETIKMNTYLRDDLPHLSDWLVHEGYHVSVYNDKKLEIDEEIESRNLQAQYEERLFEGITCNGKNYILKKQKETEVINGVPTLIEIGTQVTKFYKQNKLVDWILTIPAYRDKEDIMDASWIIKHIDDWGGVRNRTLATRIYYAKFLANYGNKLFRNKSLDSDLAKTLKKIIDASGPFDASKIKKEAGESEVDNLLK